MNMQNQVVLSIGTNQGERLINIQRCLSLLHQNTGTVVKVSQLYETPSWGFDSADFYNCAVLLHTHKSASELLQAILTAEEELGRIRIEQPGYQPRVIDIDIVSYNNDIIESTDLVVPHPQMQHRLFVLLPLRDVKPEYVHPVLKQSVAELLSSCSDSSAFKVVSGLKQPLSDFRLDTFNYIAIEGNIGAGKTTLTTKIAEDFNAKTVFERFADNPFLPKFYNDQSRYAFSLEMSFLADRYQQLSDDLAQFDLFKDFIVADYHVFKSLIFAKVTLTEDEYRLYRKLFEIIYKEMPKPDLYVYLYQNTERLLQNIRQRGRSYEQEIPAEYLDKINKGYLDYIKSQTDLRVLIIDVSDKDFVENQQDYIYILEQIREKIEN